MWKFFSAPRQVQTTICCHNCQSPLLAKRTCHEAFLRCESCGKEFTVQEYVPEMDTALEDFLEALNCDRV